MRDVKLSKNFWLSEFLNSNTANRLHIDQADFITPEHIKNIELLVKNLIQPLRNIIKMPIKITSGYRCEAVNGAINGSVGSLHTTGQASDMVCGDMIALWRAFEEVGLPYHQRIWYYHGDKIPQWIHADWCDLQNYCATKRATLQSDGTKTYEIWGG